MADTMPTLTIRVVGDFTQLSADLAVYEKRIADLKAAAADAGVSIATQVEEQFNQAFNPPVAPSAPQPEQPVVAPAPVEQPAVDQSAPAQSEPAS